MERRPTTHRMGRREFTHDYSRPGIYHITIHVAEGMGQPLGEVVGTDADSAAVRLTQAGVQVEHELLTAITTHYEMITVDEHVIMPDHLHFILNVRAPIISKNGRPTHLGQVIAGFKAGCNRAFWAATGGPAAKPQGALAPAASASSGFAAGNGAKKARYTTGRAPLFAPGYCDVMPIEPGQLETQRAYIRNNPRSRWLRSHDRARLQTQRGGIDTALTPSALRGYLQRECPRQFSAEAFALIEGRLLKKPGGKTAGSPGGGKEPGGAGGGSAGGTSGGKEPGGGGGGTAGSAGRREPGDGGGGTAGSTSGGKEPGARGGGSAGSPGGGKEPSGGGAETAGGPAQTIDCDTYGDRALLGRRLLPVVCHRSDKARFNEQKARCLEEAERGAVLVSPRIAPGEQAIIDEAVNRGFAVILIADNGFPEIYHPSTERINRCADGSLLMVTPWQYHYRRTDEDITVMECKSMNCVAQALCRTRDDWWK